MIPFPKRQQAESIDDGDIVAIGTPSRPPVSAPDLRLVAVAAPDDDRDSGRAEKDQTAPGGSVAPVAMWAHRREKEEETPSVIVADSPPPLPPAAPELEAVAIIEEVGHPTLPWAATLVLVGAIFALVGSSFLDRSDARPGAASVTAAAPGASPALRAPPPAGAVLTFGPSEALTVSVEPRRAAPLTIQPISMVIGSAHAAPAPPRAVAAAAAARAKDAAKEAAKDTQKDATKEAKDVSAKKLAAPELQKKAVAAEQLADAQLKAILQ